MRSQEEWLNSGGYLPSFLRDFHAQKDVFKFIWRSVLASKEDFKKKGKFDYLADLSWISAHVFTVDYFLWIMAKYGYTLQRVRGKPWESKNLSEALEQMRLEQIDAFKAMLEKTKAP